MKRARRMGFLLALLMPATAVGDGLEGLDVILPRQQMEAPEVQLEKLGGGQGGVREYVGDLVLIHFFATWCRPCRRELPEVEKLWQRYRDRGFTVLAVAADVGNPKKVEKFVSNLGLSFPVLLDPKGQMRNAYEVVGLPFSYLVGRDGRFRAKVIGEREWNGAEAVAAIEQLLAEGDSQAQGVAEAPRLAERKVLP